MFKIFKLKHEHNWELVAVNDKYHTTYSDTNETKYWQMRFYKCNCGKRKFSDNRPYTHIVHEGIGKARANWIDAGVVPVDSYHPTESTNYVKIDDTPKEQLDPLEQLNKTVEELCLMMNVIKRDFDLEKQYPKLKSISDQYQRELSKYRTFESLKGKDNVT
jgi:hypothetical protein